MIANLSKVAVFTAVAVAVGYLFAAVPNVEGISAVSFFAGYLLGYGPGAAVGALSIMMFSLFNPLGPPVPPVLLAQLVAMGLVGISGAFWRRLIRRFGKPEIFAVALGALLTFGYSVAVDYGFAVSIGRWKHPLPVIVAGIPFSAVHIISNALIFGGVGAFMARKYKPAGA
jgi:hypothetical protein